MGDDRVVALGGSAALCPPTASCAGPPTPDFDDTAIFDIDARTWRALPTMPIGVASPRTVAVGNVVYVLATCPVDPTCGIEPALLRLDLATETWDTFPAPAGRTYSHLVALGDRVVNVVDSDESREVPDEVFDPATGDWRPLPDDPLPDSYDRFAVGRDGQLFLFGSPIDDAGSTTSTKLGAVYDPERAAWSDLPESGRPGYQVWDVGDRLVLNGYFGPDHGGMFDPATQAWSDLPRPGPTIRRGRATWPAPSAATRPPTPPRTAGSWTRPRGPDRRATTPGPDAVREQESVAATGRLLVVFGGARWEDGEGGELVGEAWTWTPPSP